MLHKEACSHQVVELDSNAAELLALHSVYCNTSYLLSPDHYPSSMISTGMELSNACAIKDSQGHATTARHNVNNSALIIDGGECCCSASWSILHWLCHWLSCSAALLLLFTQPPSCC